MNKIRNASGLFNLFEHDAKDKISSRLETVGKYCFGLLFLSQIVFNAFSKYMNEHETALRIVVAAAIIGAVGGLGSFLSLGARISGQAAGVTSLPRQIGRILWRTFIFLILPLLILAIIIVFVAIKYGSVKF